VTHPTAPLDAVVIGSGPNGLAAAITLARAGKSVLVREAADTIGGGARSAELTLPGFVHDTCSTVHALVPISPFFKSLPLAEHGLELVTPPIAFAHPLDDGTAALAHRSIDDTAQSLGPDAPAYRDHLGPLARSAESIFADTLRPLSLPHHPLAMARFGLRALRSARGLAGAWFTAPRARALFAGAAAHAILPFDYAGTAAFGLMMHLSAHAGGWPFARGGSQKVADALASLLRSLGGQIVTGAPVESLDSLPSARAILCDVTPRQFLRLAGDRLTTGRYRRALERFQYGPGAFKVDWALAGPIPWTAPAVRDAGTVHLGGTLEEIAAGEAEIWQGKHPQRPFVLLTQPTPFDPTRAPAGRHTAWAYCHVPHGSNVDMTAAIEAQVERFAPGFRDLILARHTADCAALERRNPNLVGGDITGGANTLRQVLARPVATLHPYATPLPGVYLCSASTPPGAGVHGLCGHNAANAALRDVFK
jgi:phytoene dehydrogenase-like protein